MRPAAEHASGAAPGRLRLRVGLLGRIVIALAAAGLIPVAVVSFRLADLNREALTSQVLQTHSLAADSGAAQIENTVSGWASIADVFAASPAIRSGPGSPDPKEAVRALLSSRSDLLAVAIDDAAGAEVLRGVKKSAAAAAQEMLSSTQKQPLRVASVGGRVLLSMRREVAAGITTTLIFDAQAISAALESSELGGESVRLLIARTGQTVVGSADARKALPRPLLDLAVNGRVRGSGRFTLPGGREAVGAYSPVSGTDWVVVSTQPATVAEAIAQNLRTRSLLAIGAAILLVAALSLTGWLVVVRPLGALLDAQAEIGLGGGGGSDVDRLRGAIDLLNKRVRDRADLGQVFLGRYQVLEIVGQGGMGTVFRGWDPKLQRPVALKTVRLAERAETSERRSLISALMREAVTVARFHHASIVSIFDVEETPDAAFIAMEFVDGVSLESQLTGASLSVEQTAVVGIAIASALEAAHAAGVVHRDVKPANVLISWDGAVKVTDFGIADLLNAVRLEEDSVYGTPGYMAPEVIRGRGATPASDLFGTGVVLYRCLTGVQPFSRDTVQQVLRATLSNDPLPPSTFNPAVPKAMDELILRLLSKKGSERIASAAELLDSLRGFTDERRFKLSQNPNLTRTTQSREQDPMYVPTVSLSKADV